jgi:hypothetical protein
MEFGNTSFTDLIPKGLNYLSPEEVRRNEVVSVKIMEEIDLELELNPLYEQNNLIDEIEDCTLQDLQELFTREMNSYEKRSGEERKLEEHYNTNSDLIVIPSSIKEDCRKIRESSRLYAENEEILDPEDFIKYQKMNSLNQKLDKALKKRRKKKRNRRERFKAVRSKLMNQELVEQEEKDFLIKFKTKRKRKTNREVNVQEKKPPDESIQGKKEMEECFKKKPPDKISKNKVKEFVGEVYEKMIGSSLENQKEAKLCAELNFSTEATFKLYRTRDIILLITKRLHDIISNSKEIMNLLYGEVPKVIMCQNNEEIPEEKEVVKSVSVPSIRAQLPVEEFNIIGQEIWEMIKKFNQNEQKREIDVVRKEMNALLEETNDWRGRRSGKHPKESRQR